MHLKNLVTTNCTFFFEWYMGGFWWKSCETLKCFLRFWKKTCTARKQARWLLDQLNNYPGFLATSENYAQETVKGPYDLTCTNDVIRSHLSVALQLRWLQVASACHQHINWTYNKRTSHLVHAYINCSGFRNQYFRKMIMKTIAITIRESLVLPFIKIKSKIIVLNLLLKPIIIKHIK